MAESELEKATKEIKKDLDTLKALKEEMDSVFVENKETVNKEDEADFEETRRCLLNNYHNYVQNHVGYMIAIVVALLGLVLSSENLFKVIGNFVFVFLGIIILGLFYDFVGIKYWTSYANTAIILPKSSAIKLFDEYPRAKKYNYNEEAPAPCTVILQFAIAQFLRNEARKSIILKIVLKIKR